MRRYLPVAAAMAAAIAVLAVFLSLRSRVRENQRYDAALKEIETYEGAIGAAGFSSPYELPPGRAEAMLDEVESALVENPEDPALLGQAVHLGLACRPGSAVAWGKALLEQDKENYFALVHLATAYALENQFDKAVMVVAKAEAIAETSHTHLVRAYLYQSRGRMEEARKQYERALELDPECSTARMALQFMEPRE